MAEGVSVIAVAKGLTTSVYAAATPRAPVVAVTAHVPIGRLVVTLATPPTSGTLTGATATEPANANCTVPLPVPPISVAVKVTGAPGTAGLPLDVSSSRCAGRTISSAPFRAGDCVGLPP